MTLLRSREILPTTKPLSKRATPEPATPTQTREPSLTPNTETPLLGSGFHSTHLSDSICRRSPRFASKSAPVDDDGSIQKPNRKRKKSVTSTWSIDEEKEEIEEGRVVVNEGNLIDEKTKRDDDDDVGGVGDVLLGILRLRSGKRVVKRRMEGEGEEEENDCSNVNENTKGKGKRRGRVEDAKSERSEEGVVSVNLEQNVTSVNESGTSKRRGLRRYSREEKEKRINLEEGVGVFEKLELEKKKSSNDNGASRGRRRYSREEKGKGKLVDDGSSLSNQRDTVELELELESKVKDLVESLAGNVALEQDGTQPVNPRMEQFRDIARQNASRFAHFDTQEQEENHMPPQVDVEISEEEQQIEDWPGPFSTAMKIIRDRANKFNLQQGASSFAKQKSVPIMWIPKTNQLRNRLKGSVPSLQELSMGVLVKNADAITSLENVPDELRHRLCHLLCDSRRMNSSILDLLVRGSPTEIRIRDCSWLSEEDFTKHFEGCDTSGLTVLQLDQCGRCMPDYILLATLARSPGSLPLLTILSVSGACRLSDVGLSSLVSSAPALRSINLSQCSLLTSTSVDTLADSLGSVLQELYIDDCQSIDAMIILPALKKLEHLEVLSLSGVQTVCDGFVREFIVARGHNMKELVLTDCVKLTDASLKVIAETCSGLCALNLVNLRKLTDSGLGYLANGCREIHTLKLCCNAFSDEAIAAFVETSGELLKELSLNNVKKVGHNTALSLARRSRKLLSLDLSWCRNLTDEAVGWIVDSCLSLRVLKLFGCSQITNVFLDGHSNPEVKIIGLKMSSVF